VDLQLLDALAGLHIRLGFHDLLLSLMSNASRVPRGSGVEAQSSFPEVIEKK
jgi:hypothetical protein